MRGQPFPGTDAAGGALCLGSHRLLTGAILRQQQTRPGRQAEPAVLRGKDGAGEQIPDFGFGQRKLSLLIRGV